MVTRATRPMSARRLSQRRRRNAKANPAKQKAPGSRTARAMGLRSTVWSEPVAVEPVPASVVTTMSLVMGAVALGWISMFCGVKAQEDWSGSPEHDSVTNMGAVRALALTGV